MLVPPPPAHKPEPSKPGTPPLSSGLKRRQALKSRLNERTADKSVQPSPTTFRPPYTTAQNRNNNGSIDSNRGLTGPCSGIKWWLSGLPCLMIVFAYGGTSSLLCGSIGTILWHVLDLAGPAWGGFALAVWWITLFTISISIAVASDELLLHSFSLILLPAALILWLFLLGIWGTLQYKWMVEESPALVVFLSEILCTLTPLLAPPILTWGALALHAVDVGYASIVLALTNHFIVKQCVFTSTTVVIGKAELLLMSIASCVLPVCVHAAVHYYMLLGPSSSSMSSFLSITNSNLDQARLDIVWEMIIFASGGAVSLFELDTEVRKRGRSLIWSTPPSNPNPIVEEVTLSSWLLSWTQMGNLPLLLSVVVFLYAIEARLVVYIAQYLEVWWGGPGLFVAACFTVAGFSIWCQVEDEEKSVVALHTLTSSAMFLITHIFGVSWLLRPMCIAACMSLCEFLTSQQLVWFMVSAITLGVSLRQWCSSKIGFLSHSLPLPTLSWLPFLGGSSAEPLSRLLLCLVVLSMVSLILPAAVWSNQNKVVVSICLTFHHVVLLLVEALMCNFDEPYPITFLVATAALHIGLSVRLSGSGASAVWSQWTATSIACGKLLTLTHFSPLAQESLFPTILLFAVLTWPMIHPSRHRIAILQSSGTQVKPLSSLIGFSMVVLTCITCVWCTPPTIYPMLSALLDSPLSSVRAMCAVGIVTCVFSAYLLARHFPHRLRLRRLSTAATVGLLLLFWLNPRTFSLNSSKDILLHSVHHGGGWALSLALLILVFVLFGAIPYQRLSVMGKFLLAACLGSCVGIWVASTYPYPSPSITALTSLQLACLAGAAALSGVNQSGSTNYLAGPIYCASLCCGVANWVLSELRHFPSPGVHLAHKKALVVVGASSSILLAVVVRLELLSKQTGGKIGRSGRKNQIQASESVIDVFIGNCATIIGWAAATYYTYLNRATNTDTLRSLLVELPLTYLLTLLKDDGGVFEGLCASNRYAIPTMVAVFKLASIPFYSLFLRGGPFLLFASPIPDSRPTSPILKGVDIARVTKARALRELSFWTATSFSTPMLESLLLVSTLPMHLFVLVYLWNKRQLFSSSTAVLFFPLNFIALVLVSISSPSVYFCTYRLISLHIYNPPLRIKSKQLGTQLLGLLGLGLGIWQQSDSRALSRSLQRRL